MSKLIDYLWYKKNSLSYFLLPLSLIYSAVIYIRTALYKTNLLKSYRVSVPVIMVGNITVGGTGKTPLVIALVDALKKNGFHPGIITRGYGGKSKTWPQCVDENSDPRLVGDEAVLMAKKTGVPVVAGPSRVASAKKLLNKQLPDEKLSDEKLLGEKLPEMNAQNAVETRVERCTQRVTSVINVIISDDGLQHYALDRDIEIAVIDASRNLGNGFCLPAGPLRESKNRLKTVDFVVVNGGVSVSERKYTMQFVIDAILKLNDATRRFNISDFQNKKILAIAAIGNPDRFFTSLRDLNLVFETRVFPDHYFFQEKDFKNLEYDIILMTEKDAVKCMNFADDRFYKAQGHAQINDDLIASIIRRLH